MTAEPVVVQVLEGDNAVASLPRSDGRHQPGQRRRRHHPQAVRPVDRRELGPRLGQPSRTPAIEIAQFFTDADDRRLQPFGFLLPLVGKGGTAGTAVDGASAPPKGPPPPGAGASFPIEGKQNPLVSLLIRRAALARHSG